MTNPQTFLIRLELTLGAYEKHSYHLITSEDENTACKIAIENECHTIEEGDIENYNAESNEHFYDCHDEFAYRVDNVTLIADQDIETLKKYFYIHTNY